MILRTIDDPILLDHYGEIATDGMDIFLLNEANFRGALLHGTRLVNQMRANHELGILETLLLGHAYVAAGLLTSLVKGRDRIILALDCEGPAGGLSAESDASGRIRGHLKNPHIPVNSPVESFDLAPYIGRGTLSVTRQLESARRPVSGTAALEHGNLAMDLANYFVVSEQLPTAVSLSIQFDREGRVSGAGGLFLQALPGADRSAGAALEETVRELPSIGSMFAEGETPAHIINRYFSNHEAEIIGSRSVEFVCSCSKDRYGSFLASLPADELNDIRENGPFPLKVTCHNCNTTYMYTNEEIETIWQSRS